MAAGPHTGTYLLDRREHPVTPCLPLRRPGDRDRMSLTRHFDFNGHLNFLLHGRFAGQAEDPLGDHVQAG
jgi:hypothetical protein